MVAGVTVDSLCGNLKLYSDQNLLSLLFSVACFNSLHCMNTLDPLHVQCVDTFYHVIVYRCPNDS